MFHSFYNNPNAIVDIESKTIIVDSENPSFDLNVPHNIEKENFDKVIQSWGKLKNYLLHNKKATFVLSTEYQDFLKHAFLGLDSSENIMSEIIITVSKYNDRINVPHAKHGLIGEKTLKDGNLFINLTAKLTFGQKTHYITLATLGTQEQIEEKAKKYKVDKDEIKNRFATLNTLLQNSDFIELKINDLDSFDFSTSTR
jgi:hypothetical protein